MYTGYQAFKDCNFKSDAKQIRHRTSFAEKFIKYTITVRYYIFTDRILCSDSCIRVTYEIMEWSKTHVTSTLYICWAAQAGLYYHYGIKKHILNKKISGVYEHHPLHNKLPIIRGFDDKFYVPHSRNTGVDGEAIRKNKELTIVAESDETGPYIILNSTGSQVFVTGHPEYDVMSLHYEYVRDVKRGLNPDIPKNYYKDDDPTKKPVKSWRCHANAMYYNWLNYYVYQVTPYDLEKDK